MKKGMLQTTHYDWFVLHVTCTISLIKLRVLHIAMFITFQLTKQIQYNNVNVDLLVTNILRLYICLRTIHFGAVAYTR